MALQSSGQISLLDIRNELGNSGEISLGASSSRNLAGVASGQISFADFYGKSTASIVSQFGGNVGATNNGTGTAIAGIQINTDGTFTAVLSASTDNVNQVSGDLWYSPATTNIGNSYWVRLTVQSGSSTFSANAGTGVWLQLNAPRSWSYATGTGTSASIRNGTWLVEIAASSGGTVIASGTYSVSVVRAGNT